MKLGIYVGSFNPIHIGHERIINCLINDKYVDKVLIIPTGNYWNKKDIISVKHRINMISLLNNDNLIIESKLNNIKYTYQIMNLLHKRYKSDELYLIIGADNIINFDKWKNYKDLLKENIIILKRNNIDITYYLNKLNKKDNYNIINNNIDISSTYIRNNINDKIIEKYLPKGVYKYIIENNLYK